MKPRNFPERKNKRRLAAIDRGIKNEATKQATIRNVVPNARNIRTKKTRSGA